MLALYCLPGPYASKLFSHRAMSPRERVGLITPRSTVNFFLHYVGQSGAARDFPKTVFADRPTSLVLENVSDNHPQKGYLLSRLGEAFPTGRWNCWGVPHGAERAIARLREGDVFLLMETHAGEGPVPALGVVEVYVPQRFPGLSRALWGESGFPYVFFFRTQPLSLTWPELRHRLGYESTYKGPIGQVQRINEAKVAQAGGPDALVAWLLQRSVRDKSADYSLFLTAGQIEVPEDREVRQAHDVLHTTAIRDEPELTDDAPRKQTVVRKHPRSEAFRLWIRDLYGGRCAVCNLGVQGPEGQPEVQSAHIYPRHKNGRDDLRNGICLCRMHHWALDIGWMAFSDERRVIVRESLPNHADYDFIRGHASRPIREPLASYSAPHPLYLRAHRALYGFE